MQNQIITEYMSKLGKMSGKNMTSEQRKERAKKASQATKRWKLKNVVEYNKDVNQDSPTRESIN